MKFRFPIVIIDEDFRSENTSGFGIRALAKAIEDEGFEVLGATSYGDLSQFAQQQSRASAFILSVDDEEVTGGPDLDPALLPSPLRPTVIVHGSADSVVPIDLSRSLATAPTLVALDDVGHFELIDPATPAWAEVISELTRMTDAVVRPPHA